MDTTIDVVRPLPQQSQDPPMWQHECRIEGFTLWTGRGEVCTWCGCREARA